MDTNHKINKRKKNLAHETFRVNGKRKAGWVQIRPQSTLRSTSKATGIERPQKGLDLNLMLNRKQNRTVEYLFLLPWEKELVSKFEQNKRKSHQDGPQVAEIL